MISGEVKVYLAYILAMCVFGGGSFSKILGEVQFLCKLVGGFPMF